MTRVGERNGVSCRIVDSAHHRHEHAPGTGLAEFFIDPCEQLAGHHPALAEAAVEADGLCHQQRGVHAFARDVAKTEANSPVVEFENGYLTERIAREMFGLPVLALWEIDDDFLQLDLATPRAFLCEVESNLRRIRRNRSLLHHTAARSLSN